MDDGVLDRVLVATSREGKRQYVQVTRFPLHFLHIKADAFQDLLAEHGADLLRMMDSGAVLYVCGDRDGMATGTLPLRRGKML